MRTLKDVCNDKPLEEGRRGGPSVVVFEINSSNIQDPLSATQQADWLRQLSGGAQGWSKYKNCWFNEEENY